MGRRRKERERKYISPLSPRLGRIILYFHLILLVNDKASQASVFKGLGNRFHPLI